MKIKYLRKIIIMAAVLLLLITCSACKKQKQNITTFLEEETVSVNGRESVTEGISTEGISTEEPTTYYYVHISGAVQNPGVYMVLSGSRLYEAIAMAGGFTEDACEDYCNQAMLLEDGMQYVIPTTEEAMGMQKTESPESNYTADGRLNLNLATKEELMSLPGIGESRADAILEYREEHGSFGTVEELMNVTGIKEGLYQDISESIAVN